MWFKTEDGRIYAQKAASDFDRMENTIKAQGVERIQLYHFYIVPMTRKTFSESKWSARASSLTPSPHTPPLPPRTTWAITGGRGETKISKARWRKRGWNAKGNGTSEGFAFFPGKKCKSRYKHLYLSQTSLRRYAEDKAASTTGTFSCFVFDVFTRLTKWSALTSQLFSVKDLLKLKIHEGSTLWSDTNLRRIKCCVFFCTTGVS